MIKRLRKTCKNFLTKNETIRCFRKIPNPRGHQGRRYSWPVIVNIIVSALLIGCKNLRAMERLAMRVSQAISDTQLSRILQAIDAAAGRTILSGTILSAWRSKSLLPLDGVSQVAIDGKSLWVGKYQATPECYRRRTPDKQSIRFGVHVLNATLVSTVCPVLIDQQAIPGKKSEQSSFPSFFKELLTNYGKTSMLQLLSLDAGFASYATAKLINDQGIGYLIGLKDNQPSLLAEAKRLLSSFTEAEYLSDWEWEKGKRIRRHLVRSAEIAGYHDWDHLRQVILVRNETVDPKTGTITFDDRYFLTNLTTGAANAKRLLKMVRNHWLIENGPHWTLDTQWKEDDAPLNARAIITVALLRALAYNGLALFRSRYLRSAKNRKRSWAAIMELISDVIILGTKIIDDDSCGRIDDGKLKTVV